MLRCASPFVVAAYAKVRLTPQDSRALPAAFLRSRPVLKAFIAYCENMNPRPVFVGVDIGASRTKVAVLDSAKRLIGHAVSKSGNDFSAAAENGLTVSLAMANASRE